MSQEPTVNLQISFSVNAEGKMQSRHQPQTEEDLKALQSMPGAGQETMAFAMLREAVRREAKVACLINFSQDPHKLVLYQAMTPAAQEKYAKDMEEKLQKYLVKMMDRMARVGIREALQDFREIPSV